MWRAPWPPPSGPAQLSLVCPLGGRRLAIPRLGTTLMVRVPDHALLRDLLVETGPVASTSANRHGRPAAATAVAVGAEVGGAVAGIVDGGPSGGMPSTIIDVSSRPSRILRKGPITSIALRPYVRG